MLSSCSPAKKTTSSSPTCSTEEVEIPCDVVFAGREVCGELHLVESREYLCTNGIGGYSSLTAASSVTRSYHGLLVAALRPPLDRTLLLSRLHETATYLNRTFHLATDRRKPEPPSPPSSAASTTPSSLPSPRPPASSRTTSAGDVVSPLGFLHLESFRLEGTVPVFTYTFADAVLEKRVWMKQGQNTVYVSYYLRRATDAVELELSAYVNHRNHHYRTQARPHFDHAASLPTPASVRVQFDTRERQRTTLSMCVDHGRACLENEWASACVLAEERARGLPDADANLLVARFDVPLLPGGRVTFVATAETAAAIAAVDGEEELRMQHAHERRLLARFVDARRRAAKRRRRISQRLNRSVPILDSWRIGQADAGVDETPPGLEKAVLQLVLAADQFIISRAGGKSVVAGFHWFTDWARDTMIALPGLTVVTGRFDVARSILVTFKKYVSKGMLPNRFPDDGSSPQEKDYNNADGTLWYFESIRSYHAATGDTSVLEELFPVLEDIVHHHVVGTRFGIKQDDDGLLAAGAEGLALTWMDAVHGDGQEGVATPRRGKPVELQALWFNALHTMALFANELGLSERAVHYTSLADRTERSFRNRFWNKSLNYCYDVVDCWDGEDDATLRANQIIATSLNWSPLTKEQRHLVVETCGIHLVTSHAVRTLPQTAKGYHGTYEGNVNRRDSAYHQGTGWVWLLGPFVIAHLRAFGDKKRARQFLTPLLRSHLATSGLGQISEIFDGDPPFRPRGCIAQAWSVSEILRAWVETQSDSGDF